jgi:hypothetical protein
VTPTRGIGTRRREFVDGGGGREVDQMKWKSFVEEVGEVDRTRYTGLVMKEEKTICTNTGSVTEEEVN